MAVQTLTSTAICGIIQSICGGQPLLIVGVSEPTSLVYTFMYKFVKDRSELGLRLFLGWAAWYVFLSPLHILFLHFSHNDWACVTNLLIIAWGPKGLTKIYLMVVLIFKLPGSFLSTPRFFYFYWCAPASRCNIELETASICIYIVDYHFLLSPGFVFGLHWC